MIRAMRQIVPGTGRRICRSLTTSKWADPATYQKVRQPVSRAISLPPEAYYDADYYNLEQKQVWQKEWFAAEHVSRLQKYGDTAVIDVGEQSYIITCDRDLQIRAFHNVCRHRGAKLCATDGNFKRINCPYHWWSYNMKGDLVGAPFFEREDFDRKMNSLHPVRCGIHSGIVWICANPSAPSLEEHFGGAWELLDYPFAEMDIIAQQKYDPQCDWKLLLENFMEWYHIPAVHPGLAQFSTVEMHQDNQREGRYNGFVTSPLTNCGGPTDLDKFNMTPGHHHINDKSPRKFNPEETAYFYAMYPNVAITIYPHSVYTLIMHPNGPGRAKEKLTVLQHPGARLSTDSDAEYEEKTKGVMDFVCEVNDEDIEICERLDKGVRQNAYTGGIH
jgi:choline monooxygenase